MTVDTSDRPGDEALLALSLGQLAEAEVAHVSSHLSECPACCRRIDQLDSDDWLLARLRQIAPGPEGLLGSPAEHRSAVRALRRSTVQNQRDAAPSKRLSDEPTEFVAPPERPDGAGERNRSN